MSLEQPNSTVEREQASREPNLSFADLRIDDFKSFTKQTFSPSERNGAERSADQARPGTNTRSAELMYARSDASPLPKLEITNNKTDYQVQKNDTLWKIAKDHLGGSKSGSDVAAYVKQIIEANKESQPDMARRPHVIHSGMHLNIPEFNREAATKKEQVKTDPAADKQAGKPPESRRPQTRESEPEKQAPKTNPEDGKPKQSDKVDQRTDEQRREEQEKQKGKDKAKPQTDLPYEPIEGKQEHGRASFYGGYFHGRKTANGEIYNQYGMTVAHKSLPFEIGRAHV